MTNSNQPQVDEIMQLWLTYQQSRKVGIREKLIENYLPLVKLVASRLAISLPQYVDKDDLISNKDSYIVGKKFRITVLSPRLIRIEYNEKGLFEDRPTSLIINRM